MLPYQQLPLFAEPPPGISHAVVVVLAAPTALIASVSRGVGSNYVT
jgi:hypothetical protein